MTIDRYKRLHADFLDDLTDSYGVMPPEREVEWTEKLNVARAEVSETDRAAFDAWVERQVAYRKEHNMPVVGEGFDLTPEERGMRTFQGEYDLIIAQDDKNVVFLIHGKEVTISTGVLLECDEEGRFWLAREDAEKLGLLN